MTKSNRLDKEPKEVDMSVQLEQHWRNLEIIAEESEPAYQRRTLTVVDDQGRPVDARGSAALKFTPWGFLYIP